MWKIRFGIVAALVALVSDAVVLGAQADRADTTVRAPQVLKTQAIVTTATRRSAKVADTDVSVAVVSG